MIYFNEHDIARHTLTWDADERPNLYMAAQRLDRFKEWVNSNSDGWNYWQKPSRAAQKLMALFPSPYSNYNAPDVTEAELKAALTPIKSFLTRHDANWRDVL